MTGTALRMSVGSIVVLVAVSPLGAQTEALCGNGIREALEQCDDGNGEPLDGCGTDCRFEQNQRINALQIQFTTSGQCSANRFGGAWYNVAQTWFQDSLDQAVASGAMSVILVLRGLDDLTGFDDAAVEVGIVNGTPVIPSGSSYDGTADLDWWYDVDGADLTPARLPLRELTGSFVMGDLDAQPGEGSLVFPFGRWSMSSLRLTAQSGPPNPPLTSIGVTPPGHLPSEHLDEALTSYATSGASLTGEMCGNISAASLAATPIPPVYINVCSSGYTVANSMLDLLVGGCVAFFVPQVAATQPDQEDPAAPPAGAGPPYALKMTATAVTGCRDASGAAVALSACLDDAAYSSRFMFATGRVIATRACPLAPAASNDGPVCAGEPLQLTATGPTGSYAWTGPNGFISSEQNPVIPAAGAGDSGTYQVTVNVAGCTSSAGSTTVTIDPAPGQPSITAPETAAAGAAGLIASVPAHAGSTFAWSIANGSITAGDGTSEITFTAGSSGTVDLEVVETAGGCASEPGTASVAILGGLPTPTNIEATAMSGSEILVTWTASAGAVEYEIARRSAGFGDVVIGSATGPPITDVTAVPGAAYLYSVRAVDASANRSPYGSPDLATAMIFADDPLAAGTVIRAVHIEQLRGAVAAVVELAGGTAGFTDGPAMAGVRVKAVHVTELRAALDTARSALLLSALAYSDPGVAAGTSIKAAHVQELRAGVE